jgi:hypothetical protein
MVSKSNREGVRKAPWNTRPERLRSILSYGNSNHSGAENPGGLSQMSKPALGKAAEKCPGLPPHRFRNTLD